LGDESSLEAQTTLPLGTHSPVGGEMRMFNIEKSLIKIVHVKCNFEKFILNRSSPRSLKKILQKENLERPPCTGDHPFVAYNGRKQIRSDRNI